MNLLSQLTATLLTALLVATFAVAAEMRVGLPRTGLVSDDLAVIVNDDDPLSQQIGSYYQKARGIPAANMIHLNFKPGHSSLTKEEFLQLKSVIDQVTPDHVQAYAIAWTSPYRVGCMSLTSALAFGYNEKYCSQKCGHSVCYLHLILMESSLPNYSDDDAVLSRSVPTRYGDGMVGSPF